MSQMGPLYPISCQMVIALLLNWWLYCTFKMFLTVFFVTFKTYHHIIVQHSPFSPILQSWGIRVQARQLRPLPAWWWLLWCLHSSAPYSTSLNRNCDSSGWLSWYLDGQHVSTCNQNEFFLYVDLWIWNSLHRPCRKGGQKFLNIYCANNFSKPHLSFSPE